MAAKLAPTVISTGPSDEVLAKDSRGATPTETVNKTMPNQPSETGESQEEEKKSKVKIPWDKIEKSVLKKISDPKVSDSSAQQGLEASIGTRLVSIYGSSKEDKKAQDKAVAAYRDDKTGRDKLSLKDASGNAVKIFDRTDPTKISQLSVAFQKIGQDAGKTGYIDEKGKFAAALGLLDQAIALGVPKLIDDIVAYVRANKEAKKVLLASTRSVILRSDLPTLNKILDIVGGAGVLQRVPDAPALLLSSYRFSWQTKPSEYPDKRVELFDTLDRILPDWQFGSRNNEPVTDLAATNYMSSDAKKLIMLIQVGTDDSNVLDQPLFIEAMMAGSYPFTNLKDLTANMYPELAAWGV